MNAEENTKDIYNECRGKYKGYLFGIKLCSYLISHKEHLNSVKLYNHREILPTHPFHSLLKFGGQFTYFKFGG